jgi:isocitrate dehydrogenase
MFEYIGWKQASERICSGLQSAVSQKKVTYDFHRLMEGATLLKTSEFADAIISGM